MYSATRFLLVTLLLLLAACVNPTSPSQPDPNGTLVPGPCYMTPEGREVCIDTWE